MGCLGLSSRLPRAVVDFGKMESFLVISAVMATEQVIARLREFARERDWEQFHTRENLAKSISIEAAELLECFQWHATGEKGRIEQELADVLTYCFFLAMSLDVDPEEIILKKLAVTEAEYSHLWEPHVGVLGSQREPAVVSPGSTTAPGELHGVVSSSRRLSPVECTAALLLHTKLRLPLLAAHSGEGDVHASTG